MDLLNSVSFINPVIITAVVFRHVLVETRPVRTRSSNLILIHLRLMFHDFTSTCFIPVSQLLALNPSSSSVLFKQSLYN